MSWIPIEEHPAVLRYKYGRDQQLSLMSRLVRRHYLSKCLNIRWDELAFGQLAYGKPFVKTENDVWVDYNTSHDGDWVLFGCTTYPSMRVGVDTVMIHKPKTGSAYEYIKCFFGQLHTNEIEFIKNIENEATQLATFYEIWGCKESYVKALGVGLSLDLKKIEIYNNEDSIGIKYDGKVLHSWYIYLNYIDHDQIAVICCGYEDESRPLASAVHKFKMQSQLLGTSPDRIMDNSIIQHVNLIDILNKQFKTT